MTDINPWITVVTSAAVGALVSAGIGFLGQYLERRARRKELLLTKAIDLAFRRTDVMFRIAERNNRGMVVRDDASLTGDYYRILEHLFEHGVLPSDFKAHEAEEEAKIGIKENK